MNSKKVPLVERLLIARMILLAVTLILTGMVSAGASNPKNVLFIMVDDLRPQLAGYTSIPPLHGTTKMHTPAMDRLSRDGFTFTRAYCSVPICGASRLSLLTSSRPYKEPGKNWGRHLTYTSRLDLEDRGSPAGLNHPGVTLPQHFKNNGYVLYSIDKVYHNKDDDNHVWDGLIKREHPWKGVPAYEIGTGEKNDDEAYPDGRNTTDVIEILERIKNEKFVYFVGFPRPHLPFWAPQKYWDLYPEASITLPDNYSLPIHAPNESIHKWEELRNYDDVAYSDDSKKRLEDSYARTLIRGYYASVSYVDAQIQRILTTLENTYDDSGNSLYENTIVVLWGDHGWNLGEHTLWAKHALYNTSTQIPIVIRDPDFEGGKTVSALVESVDLYPTLCDLTGIGRPRTTIDNDGASFQLHGSSLVPLMNEANAKWKPAIFTRYEKGDSIRTERYAYTEFVNDEDELVAAMLYDLKHDPDENYNIVGSNPDLQHRLSELLGSGPVGKRNAWRKFVDADKQNLPYGTPLNLPEPHYPDDYFDRN